MIAHILITLGIISLVLWIGSLFDDAHRRAYWAHDWRITRFRLCVEHTTVTQTLKDLAP